MACCSLLLTKANNQLRGGDKSKGGSRMGQPVWATPSLECVVTIKLHCLALLVFDAVN